MKLVITALAVLLTGCASDGWRYMAPPKGTYSMHRPDLNKGDTGSYGFRDRPPTYYEYQGITPTGRRLEGRQ